MKKFNLISVIEKNGDSFTSVSKKSELCKFIFTKLEKKLYKRKVLSQNSNNDSLLNSIKKSINVYLFENSEFFDVSIVFNTKKFLRNKDINVDTNTLNKIVEIVYSISDDIFMLYDNELNELLGNRNFDTSVSKCVGLSSFEMVGKNEIIQKMITTYYE